MPRKKGVRLGIKRPASGICQFCLKIISAANWSRHLQSMHQDKIVGIKKEGEEITEANLIDDRSSPEFAPIERSKQLNNVVEPITRKYKKSKKIKSNDSGNAEQAGDEPVTPLRRSKRNGNLPKRRITSRCTIKLPKSGICPLCLFQTRQSNWARHVKRHHPEYTTPINKNNNNENINEDKERNLNEEQIPPCSSKSVQQEEEIIDLPMLQLEQFLNQQINQHNNNNNNLFLNQQEEEKKGLNEEEDQEEDGEQQIHIIKEMDEGEEEDEQAKDESYKSDEELFKELFPGRRIIIRRPANGICQFCLKPISASNWSRHLRTLHLPDIFELKKHEIMSSKIDQQQQLIPTTSQNNNNTIQILNEIALTATAMATESKEIKLKNFEIIEGPVQKQKEDSVDKTIASVIEGIKNDEKKLKRKLIGIDRKRMKKSKSIIRLPKTNICPLCERQVSPGNWSRHLKRHHPDYALPPEDEEKQNNNFDNDDYYDVEEEEDEISDMNNSPIPIENGSASEEKDLLWSLCQQELNVQSTISILSKKAESIKKKILNYQNTLTCHEITIQELKIKSDQLAEQRKELLIARIAANKK